MIELAALTIYPRSVNLVVLLPIPAEHSKEWKSHYPARQWHSL